MPRRIALPKRSLTEQGRIPKIRQLSGLALAVRRGDGHSDPSAGLRASREFCRELTRREARNFYWGFLALPRDQRIAIYALYGFARQVDDDIDLHLSRNDPEAVEPFGVHRDRIERTFAGESSDPVMRVLADVIPRYGIERIELEALIRGVEMDLLVHRYKSWDDLSEYCNLVASTVGRMCVRVFGYSDPVALEYADDLGLAMQLTNILRDVREDLDMDRIYLPQEELRQYEVSEDGLRSAEPGAGWEPLVHFQVRRAENLFASGLRVTDPIPRRAAACVLTMSGMYRSILHEIDRDPYLPLRQRAHLGKRAKLSVMARSWLQAM